MSRHQSVALDVIEVQAPCPASWESMAGDERVRFCVGCGHPVHNLGAMTRDEAERLVCEAAGRLCVRFERDAGGAVRTLGYRSPAPGAAARGRGWRFWTGLGATLAAAVGAVNTYVSGSPFRMTAPAPAPRMMTLGMVALPAAPPNPGMGADSPDADGGERIEDRG